MLALKVLAYILQGVFVAQRSTTATRVCRSFRSTRCRCCCEASSHITKCGKWSHLPSTYPGGTSVHYHAISRNLPCQCLSTAVRFSKQYKPTLSMRLGQQMPRRAAPRECRLQSVAEGAVGEARLNGQYPMTTYSLCLGLSLVHGISFPTSSDSRAVLVSIRRAFLPL